MTNDDYQNAMDWVNKQPVNVVNLAIKSALQLAQEAEQVRNRLAELENALSQANNKIKWYERTEATND